MNELAEMWKGEAKACTCSSIAIKTDTVGTMFLRHSFSFSSRQERSTCVTSYNCSCNHTVMHFLNKAAERENKRVQWNKSNLSTMWKCSKCSYLQLESTKYTKCYQKKCWQKLFSSELHLKVHHHTIAFSFFPSLCYARRLLSFFFDYVKRRTHNTLTRNHQT